MRARGSRRIDRTLVRPPSVDRDALQDRFVLERLAICFRVQPDARNRR